MSNHSLFTVNQRFAIALGLCLVAYLVALAWAHWPEPETVPWATIRALQSADQYYHRTPCNCCCSFSLDGLSFEEVK